MSVESQQSLVNGLMSFRFEIKDMGARIEYLIALRKRLSHKEKKIDDEEYEQAMNTPSMIVLYEAYKQAADHATNCKRAVDQRMRQYSNKFVLAPPEVQMEIYGLQVKWIQATINTAEQRLDYLQHYPFAYQNRNAIRGHITAAEDSMKAAKRALGEVDRNKRATSYETSDEASSLFEKGNHHALENSIVLVYGLHDVTSQDFHRACEIAAETFAKKIMNWPNGRSEKPETFKVESHGRKLRDSNDCFGQFIDRLRDVFETSPPKDLPVYPRVCYYGRKLLGEGCDCYAGSGL
ncbi:uncharacterized protein FTJAE_7297 [Fusarium tjaetaba]|uniref:Uncharacterized protein n=1 Tax=Fusarium tjaetaba TaxID=1567544 RepID=A0A8H5RHC6_9HYPO|nr:uncharacterized protein FTJAE_7297 [Fusarium tjaetaba]KAF5633118.1 hypothetical protein FTJAE_7297 [Fusarium tjaetaba]